jgi:hypothetical protein
VDERFGDIGMPSSLMGQIFFLSHWKEAFKDEFGLVILGAKPSSNALLKNWLSSLP